MFTRQSLTLYMEKPSLTANCTSTEESILYIALRSLLVKAVISNDFQNTENQQYYIFLKLKQIQISANGKSWLPTQTKSLSPYIYPKTKMVYFFPCVTLIHYDKNLRETSK